MLSEVNCKNSTFTSNYHYLSCKYDLSHSDWYIDTSHLLGKVQLKRQQETNRQSARILHRAPPRLQVDQNFQTQKIVADPKMRCRQNSFGIWSVREAILGQETFFFFKKHLRRLVVRIGMIPESRSYQKFFSSTVHILGTVIIYQISIHDLGKLIDTLTRHCTHKQ